MSQEPMTYDEVLDLFISQQQSQLNTLRFFIKQQREKEKEISSLHDHISELEIEVASDSVRVEEKPGARGRELQR